MSTVPPVGQIDPETEAHLVRAITVLKGRDARLAEGITDMEATPITKSRTMIRVRYNGYQYRLIYRNKRAGGAPGIEAVLRVLRIEDPNTRTGYDEVVPRTVSPAGGRDQEPLRKAPDMHDGTDLASGAHAQAGHA